MSEYGSSGVDVTVTVRVVESDGTVTEYTQRRDARNSDPGSWWTATDAEQAIAAAGRQVVSALVGAYGDARDMDGTTLLRDQEKRPLTAAEETR